MARIENHQYTIEEAFRECFYIVPDYQREYVWTEREVRQLLDDVCEQIDGSGDKDYFIGTVIVAPKEQKGHFEVIDGQQRLTTFFLLLCALKVKFVGQPHEAVFRNLTETNYTDASGEMRRSLKLEPRYENAGDVIAALVSADGDPEAVRTAVKSRGIPSFGSLENLLNAYGIVWAYLNENMDEPADLKKFWGYLANHVVFIQISTDVSSALKIFETINERGVGLNPMDLLKNLLFTHVSPTDFTHLKDEWKKITSPLEKAKEKPLRFLRYFLMANYVIQNPNAKDEKERTEPVLREDQIYDWLTNPVHASKCGYTTQPFEFVRKVARAAELYVGFAKDQDNDGQYGWQMDNLRKLAGAAFSMHTILLMAASPLPRSLFLHFVAQLECFMFAHFFTQTPAKELERTFSTWSDELRAIAANGDAGAQKDQLNAFLMDRFGTNIDSKDKALSDMLRRYDLNSLQRYRTKYLLAKLTQHVDMAFQGTKEPGYLTDTMKLEIEHILPNNPSPELRAAFESENPGVAYDEAKIRLGNLTLLEKPINIVLGNDFFAEKRKQYPNCASYLTRSIAGLAEVGTNTSISRINEKLRAFDEWNVEAIDLRQAMLAGLAREVWRLKPMD